MPNIPPESASLQTRLDPICDAFEDAWKRNEQPSLLKFLSRSLEEDREALAQELVFLDLHYRSAKGDVLTQEDYARQLPELQDVVRQVFAAAPDPNRTRYSVDPDLDATIDTSAPAIEDDLHSGERIKYFGDYEIIDEIARGGMGVVYRAKQISLNRIIALKMILSGHIAGEDQIRRFQLEAEAAANLDHPGIVPIYDIGEHDGQHYFSMKLIEGESLSKRLADGPIGSREAAKLMISVCDAISHAHQRNVIHRDLKPGNILIGADESIQVTDFGLAKRIDDASDMTTTGQVLGTPGYMPPEQAAGRIGQIDARSDVYSLGAILYALATGRPPFQAASAVKTLVHVMEQEPLSPRQLNSDIPRDLETICLKCLQKSPDRRYQSAALLNSDLHAFVNGEPISARPTPWWEIALMWARREPALAGFAAFYVLVYFVSIVGLGGFIARNEAIVAGTRACLGWALPCSIFGSMLGFLGAVFGNLFVRALRPGQALLQGFIAGAAIGGVLGVIYPYIGAAFMSLSDSSGIVITPLWAAFTFGAFRNVGSHIDGDASEPCEIDRSTKLLLAGRTIVFAIGILYLVAFGLLMAVGDHLPRPDSSFTEADLLSNTTTRVLFHYPFFSTLGVIFGGFVGAVFGWLGSALANMFRPNTALRIASGGKSGGQLGMLVGMLFGTLLALYFIVSQNPIVATLTHLSLYGYFLLMVATTTLAFGIVQPVEDSHLKALTGQELK